MCFCISRNISKCFVLSGRNRLKFTRLYCTRAIVQNSQWQLDPAVNTQIQDGAIKPRMHPGRTVIKNLQMPAKLLDAIDVITEKYPGQDLKTKAAALARYLEKRKRPMEDEELTHTAQQLELRKIKKDDVDFENLSPQELEVYGEKLRASVLKSLKKHVYHWKPVKYDAYTSMMYVMSMMPLNYATLCQIFTEIKARDQDFRPRTMFDFGSGVGSAIWSVNAMWPDSVCEHYCVDSSQDMNTVARLLLQGGDEDADCLYPGVHFRHFMPLAPQATFDLVTCAFSLLELPSQQERLKQLARLWAMTNDYLVITELGSLEGFQVVMEARAFILDMFNHPDRTDPAGTVSGAHVFAPCPHDGACHQLEINFTKKKKKPQPCNFPISYAPLIKDKENVTHTKNICYVVLKKGSRLESEPRWPRLLQNITHHERQKAVSSVQCCPQGRIESSVLSSTRGGKNLYRVALASSWGDRLPVVLVKPQDEETVLEERLFPDNTEAGRGS